MDLKYLIEALVFASQKPLTSKEVVTVLKAAVEAQPEDEEVVNLAKVKPQDIEAAFQALRSEYDEAGKAFCLIEGAQGWQIVTRPECAQWVRQLFPENRPTRLSAPALETLAIIAYRQPITRADLEAVRGVSVDGVMQTLLDRGLVRIAGRADVPGRPLLYETTSAFLDHFGLKDLDALPNAEELRKVELPKAEIPQGESEGKSAKGNPEAQIEMQLEPAQDVAESSAEEPVAINQDALSEVEDGAEESADQEEDRVSSDGEEGAR